MPPSGRASRTQSRAEPPLSGVSSGKGKKKASHGATDRESREQSKATSRPRRGQREVRLVKQSPQKLSEHWPCVIADKG